MLSTENYPVLIQFGFKARRGKDTACALIQEEFGDRFTIKKYAYADALRSEVWWELMQLASKKGYMSFENGKDLNDPALLKELMRELCSLHNIAFDENAPAEPIYPATKQRTLYQSYATDKRAADPFHYVNQLRARVEADRPQFALVSDMRARNEFAYGQSFKGYNVKLVRPELDDKEALDAGQAKHWSETQLDSMPDHKFYRVIRANTEDELKSQVRQLMNDIIAELMPPPELQALAAALDFQNAA